jgi:hypothetical protein
MGTFKTKTATTADIATSYSGRTVVFLEGQTDVALFANQWFVSWASKLDFQQPSSAGGCNAVVASVAEMRRDGKRAFGIVDRDKLHSDRKWALVCETDDDAFDCAMPYGEHVKVTRYWELENYVIDPEAIEHYVALRDRGRPRRPEPEATSDCLAHAETLIPHAALNSALHDEGKPEWKDGCTTRYQNRAAFEAFLHACHDRGDISDQTWQAFKTNLASVEAFGDAATPRERLRGLLRRINGKALIHRIKQAANLKDDPFFGLADLIRQHGRIPDELKSYIEQFARV